MLCIMSWRLICHNTQFEQPAYDVHYAAEMDVVHNAKHFAVTSADGSDPTNAHRTLVAHACDVPVLRHQATPRAPSQDVRHHAECSAWLLTRRTDHATTCRTSPWNPRQGTAAYLAWPSAHR